METPASESEPAPQMIATTRAEGRYGAMRILRDTLIDLYRGEMGAEPPQELLRELDETIASYGIDAHPAWLSELFEATRDGRATGKVRAPRLSPDAESFLYEVALLLKWENFRDEGECTSFDLPRRGVHVFISREALSASGTPCHLYEVSLLPAAPSG